MMHRTIIIDDSPLAEAVGSLCGVGAGDVLREEAKVPRMPDMAHRVLLHAAHGRGQRRSANGVELLLRLRRDYRFPGEIFLYAIEPLASLAVKQPTLGRIEAGADEWNAQFFQLPQAREELRQASGRPEARLLSAHALTEFILRHGCLEEYFSAEWSNVVHWLQGSNWHQRLSETNFRILLRNTEDLGPLWLARRGAHAAPDGTGVAASLSLLQEVAQNGDSADEWSVREAAEQVQGWLHGEPDSPVGTGVEIPERALENFCHVLIADDDGYDTRALQALGYIVALNTRSPAEARDYLKDEPQIFLCDLRWADDSRVGVELAEAAVASGVEVVILMSAGTDFPEGLPPEVIKCAGSLRKRDAAYIHTQIVNAYHERKQKLGDTSDTSV